MTYGMDLSFNFPEYLIKYIPFSTGGAILSVAEGIIDDRLFRRS